MSSDLLEPACAAPTPLGATCAAAAAAEDQAEAQPQEVGDREALHHSARPRGRGGALGEHRRPLRGSETPGVIT